MLLSPGITEILLDPVLALMPQALGTATSQSPLLETSPRGTLLLMPALAGVAMLALLLLPASLTIYYQV